MRRRYCSWPLSAAQNNTLHRTTNHTVWSLDHGDFHDQFR